MTFSTRVYKVKTLLSAKLGLTRPQVDLATFGAPESLVRALKADPPSPIFKCFFAEDGRPVHKWAHYLSIYEQYFARWRDEPISFLEIGVLDGGSLDFWRRYFGTAATITGIDLNPQCAELVTAPNQVRIGSQADAEFLEEVAKEFGPFDVVLDDGSHIGTHQNVSFEALFPYVKAGGLYVIEDTHTSYWPDHDGGFRRNTSAIELGKSIVDDLHGWYHHHARRSWVKNQVAAVHFHDSMIFFEKHERVPTGMMRGGGLPRQSTLARF